MQVAAEQTSWGSTHLNKAQEEDVWHITVGAEHSAHLYAKLMMSTTRCSNLKMILQINSLSEDPLAAIRFIFHHEACTRHSKEHSVGLLKTAELIDRRQKSMDSTPRCLKTSTIG